MTSFATTRARSAIGIASLSPGWARGALAGIVLSAALGGVLATGADATTHAVADAGAELARVLRAMALLKAMMAVGVAASVYWRLGTAATWPWLAGYLASCAAMAVGPGVIWGMAHVGAGAVLVHLGLLATVLLLWRDPAVGARLAAIVAARRAALRVGRG